MSTQVVTASFLAALTLFMAAALLTAGSAPATSTPAVASVQAAQANG